MASTKEYGYYIEGNKIALVQGILLLITMLILEIMDQVLINFNGNHH